MVLWLKKIFGMISGILALVAMGCQQGDCSLLKFCVFGGWIVAHCRADRYRKVLFIYTELSNLETMATQRRKTVSMVS